MSKQHDWFKIQPQAKAAVTTDEDDDRVADVYIYEQIGESWWSGEGVGAATFAKQLAELDVDTIRLYLNSPGGAAWDGITIMNALRRHKARIEVTVDGIAASAASVIAMAGDHITMNRGAEMMIHDASGGAWGTASTMEETAEILHKLSDSIADTYAARAGGTRQQWRDAMLAESWYTAEEAVEAGLADDWADAPAATAAFDTSKLGFAYAGRAQAPAPRLEFPVPPVSSEPGESNRKENVVAYDALKAGLRERLGVTEADASDETLLAALDEALAEQPTNENPAVPEGTVLMDAEQLASLQADAAAGREALAAQTAERRDSIVDRAVNEGRIAPKSREHFRNLLDKDEEGTASLIASLAANTAVPVSEIGHQPQTEGSEDDELYNRVFGTQSEEA